jgi:hypothetical protein
MSVESMKERQEETGRHSLDSFPFLGRLLNSLLSALDLLSSIRRLPLPIDRPHSTFAFASSRRSSQTELFEELRVLNLQVFDKNSGVVADSAGRKWLGSERDATRVCGCASASARGETVEESDVSSASSDERREQRGRDVRLLRLAVSYCWTFPSSLK